MNMFELLKVLADAEIEFVLVGGLAVALQGYQRVTMKTGTGRSKDLIDIEELRKIQVQR